MDHIDAALYNLERQIAADRDRRAAGLPPSTTVYGSSPSSSSSPYSSAHRHHREIAAPIISGSGLEGYNRTAGLSPSVTAYSSSTSQYGQPSTRSPPRGLSPYRESGRYGQPPTLASSQQQRPIVNPITQRVLGSSLPHSPPPTNNNNNSSSIERLRMATSPGGTRRVLSDAEIFASARRSSPYRYTSSSILDSNNGRTSPSDSMRVGPASAEYRIDRQSSPMRDMYADATPPVRTPYSYARLVSPPRDGGLDTVTTAAGSNNRSRDAPGATGATATTTTAGGKPRPVSPRSGTPGGGSNSKAPKTMEDMQKDTKALREMFVTESMIRRESEMRTSIMQDAMMSRPMPQMGKMLKAAAGASRSSSPAAASSSASAKPTTTNTTAAAAAGTGAGAAGTKPATSTTTTAGTKPATTTTTATAAGTTAGAKPATTTTAGTTAGAKPATTNTAATAAGAKPAPPPPPADTTTTTAGTKPGATTTTTTAGTKPGATTTTTTAGTKPGATTTTTTAGTKPATTR